MIPDARSAQDLRRRLARWYRAHRRDLPWRRTRDPYAIWISEAMLQQTRVEAVLDHYARFLERFPDVVALGTADEEDVVAAWSGLGYYRRARALHRAAKVVVEKHGGRFPTTRDALLELPGVGPYTAGAVASIAFDEAAPIVDGNVARVFARLFAIEEAIDRPATQRRLWELAAALVPPPVDGVDEVEGGKEAGDEPSPGTWNQALMELGALVCRPRGVDCDACPLDARCLARRGERVAELPRRTPRPTPLDVELEALWIEAQGGLLLRRRPADGRMARMWELPTRERPGADGLLRLWGASFPANPFGRLRKREPALFVVRHAITRHRIRLTVYEASPCGAAADLSDASDWRIVSRGELAELALTGMTRKVVARQLRAADGLEQA